MNRRIVLFIKMLVLSVALIVVFAAITDDTGSSDDSGQIDAEETDTGYTQYDFAMGTALGISIYDEKNASRISELTVDSIKWLDDMVISWRNSDSELYKLNNGYAAGKPYEISDTLYTAVSEAYGLCRDSGGALDITIRPLADVWNIENADSESFTVPSQDDIDESLECVGYEALAISDKSEDKCTLTIDRNNMVVDFGAVGKGYALDIVKQVLVENNADGAVISVGGSIMVYGAKPDGSDWKVGVRNPQGDAEDMIGYLSFPAGTSLCISTSGDYEKYFTVDGVRYHHILDRVTGYPAYSGLSSVTVVCENGLVSDGLSTACFVLGYEKSLALLEKYNAEAVFIDFDNNVTVTDGLKDRFN